GPGQRLARPSFHSFPATLTAWASHPEQLPRLGDARRRLPARAGRHPRQRGHVQPAELGPAAGVLLAGRLEVLLRVQRPVLAPRGARPPALAARRRPRCGEPPLPRPPPRARPPPPPPPPFLSLPPPPPPRPRAPPPGPLRSPLPPPPAGGVGFPPPPPALPRR